MVTLNAEADCTPTTTKGGLNAERKENRQIPIHHQSQEALVQVNRVLSLHGKATVGPSDDVELALCSLIEDRYLEGLEEAHAGSANQ